MAVTIAVLRPLLWVQVRNLLMLLVVMLMVTCLRDLETVSLALLRFLHPPGMAPRLMNRLLVNLLIVMDMLFVLKLP